MTASDALTEAQIITITIAATGTANTNKAHGRKPLTDDDIIRIAIKNFPNGEDRAYRLNITDAGVYAIDFMHRNFAALTA